ncbi:hypothetical protein XELAEV_18026828mg [Xenopus laevis]|uniref:Uncharacterized protein n=1 Tax=Xenopus laevis TaxID=8355 RepID=A0A974HJ38_XENLA|nr:hypothetical protein XELAEV_18026828mg [Xenopus laevis]
MVYDFLVDLRYTHPTPLFICLSCHHMTPGMSFVHPHTGHRYKIRHHITCNNTCNLFNYMSMRIIICG